MPAGQHVIAIDEESFARCMGVDSLAKVRRELVQGVRLRETLAIVRQLEAAKEMDGSAWAEEIGECDMVIDAHAFHAFGQHYGYECWDDPEFVRDFKSGTPECRVWHVPRRPSIIVPGRAAPNPTARLVAV